MIFDAGIKNLISAAYSENYDIFLNMQFPSLEDIVLDNAKSLVLLPGSFGGFAPMPYSDFRNGRTEDFREIDSLLTVADVRYMSDEGFRNMLTRSGCTRIVIPFAECADSGEYGYREAYSWVGEYKAETTGFCQTVAFISSSYDGAETLARSFDCTNVIKVGKNTFVEPRIYKVQSPVARFFAAASEAEKYPFEKICIFFNSRLEARQFGSFLYKRRTPYFLLDGSVTTDERRRIFRSISADGKGIVLATKSLLPDAVYYGFSKCIFIGVPYSFSHLERCAFAARGARPLIIYCDSDYERNGKILLSFAELTGDKNIYTKRQQSLFEIKNYLESR